MAERRRRRRLSEEESGEEVSEDSKEVKTRDCPSECVSEDEHSDEVEVSDYESVGDGKKSTEAENGEKEEDEEGDDEDDEEEDDDEDESEEDSEEESEEDSEEESSEVESEGEYIEDGIDEERQSGDGEEQPIDDKDKELDDDEDRRNPAYVPRRGAFYEHDTRITEDAEKEQIRLIPKKKLWKDEGKWQHDRFREDQQAPKSREELMVIYGYDILASDQPPAAPPRMNKPQIRKSQQRQQLHDFIDSKWSGQRNSPDVQRKNYRNKRGSRGGTRGRLGDYEENRRDYLENNGQGEYVDNKREYREIRHEVTDNHWDQPETRRTCIDNRGDSEEIPKQNFVEKKLEDTETKQEVTEKWQPSEDSKQEIIEKPKEEECHLKKESGNDRKETVEIKKEPVEIKRDYGDNRRDYSDNRRDYSDNRRDCSDNRRDYGDNRRDHIDNRRNHGDNRRDHGDNRRDHGDSRRDHGDNRRDHGDNRRDYGDNRRDYGDNRRDYGDNRRDYGDNRRDYGDNRRDYCDNRRDYGDSRRNYGNNHRETVDNRRDFSDNRRDYGDRSYNGETKPNHSYRTNARAGPQRQFSNPSYRNDNGDNPKLDSENSTTYGFRKSPENNNNFKTHENRVYKTNYENGHRNIVDNRAYRNTESNNYCHRNNYENKKRTPDRNFSHEEVHDSIPKQKGAVLNNVEFSGSVVTANNSMEKKSYSKDRRIKGITRTRVPAAPLPENMEDPERNSFNLEAIPADNKSDLGGNASKTENVSRPKRYSTQRQRNVPEVNYPEQIPVEGTTYYSPNFTQGPPHIFHPEQGPPTHQDGAAFQPTMLQAPTPIPYTLPAPRMFGPAPVPVSIPTAPPAMLPPQYIGAGMIYGAPPHGPYQVPVMPGYQSPPPSTHSQTSALSEMFRGGTTYYSTDLQQPSPSRSPVRRHKSAIPIIDPQDVKIQKSQSANSSTPGETTTSAAESNSSEAPEAPSNFAAESNGSHSKDLIVNSSSTSDSTCTSTTVASGGKSIEETNSTPLNTAHKQVELAETCTNEQTTQPILEAAA
ncbi:Hypothetical predicted protein [Octopus vulgaris]|uniref:Protein CASC3 n=1 Tax=Octopus vulgaris TaxID=6645 RepID=A0AA36EXN1_OCTVU|nr:Hypothetical predicted protein [Octopus vulgaris]